MKIGIITECKSPPDSRVPLTPRQCDKWVRDTGLDLKVQPSSHRCFSDDEYRRAGITLSNDLSDCDVVLGVKEVPVELLLADKTFFFFSHTIKQQSYNRDLLRAILDNNIRLIDYEVLTDGDGQRLVAFGTFAGMVGAHNGLWTWGKRTGDFQMSRMYQQHDYAAAKDEYRKLKLPRLKIVLTGGGRVAMGAATTLRDMGVREVEPDEWLNGDFDSAVFTRLDCPNYVTKNDGHEFSLRDFFEHPHLYQSSFGPFQRVADIMINGIYWDNRAPAFFTRHDMTDSSFSIKVIADITCDIAPVSSIPSTLRSTTILDPVFGFDPVSGREVSAFSGGTDMMTVDNLPNELPRDASASFGQQLIDHVLPELCRQNSVILEKGTVAANGDLGVHFQYLADYVA